MDLPKLQKVVFAIGSALWSSLRDLLPIILVVLFFQLVVFRQPLPQAGKLCIGLGFVVAGLSFFIKGLEMGLFPLGEAMAYDFAKKRGVHFGSSYSPLLLDLEPLLPNLP